MTCERVDGDQFFRCWLDCAVGYVATPSNLVECSLDEVIEDDFACERAELAMILGGRGNVKLF